LTPAEGRRFALTVGGAFLVIAALLRWRQSDRVALVLGVVGGLLVLAAFAIPEKLGPVQRGWMGLALAISKVTTPIFLAVVYFGVIMPIGLIARVFGRNPIRNRPVDGSYWMARAERRGDMTNQF
jgi:hypothetical protein